MTQITMKALLETGVHFGHRTRKWNPKMDDFIFTERNGIHILDLQQTLKALKDAYELVRDSVADGGAVLFVGTKRQAQETIAREAIRCRMPYVNERWLGGTLTNWRTIRERIDHLKSLERRRDEGEFELLTKKEALTLEREIEKLNIRLGGIREMKGLPQIVFVVDVTREHTAVHESNILGLPIIAMVDTNGDPDLIDYVIPSNDDAIRAIKLIAGVMADAVIEGMAIRKEGSLEEEDISYDESGVYDFEDAEDDEELLGESTLAKLKSSELSFEEAKEKNGEPATQASATADDEPEEEADANEEVVANADEAIEGEVEEVEANEDAEMEESAADEAGEVKDEE